MTKRRKVALTVTLLVPVGLALGCAAWAHLHYRDAQRALARSEYAEAQQHFSQYLKVWFFSADGHLQAARAARRAGAYDESRRYLDLVRVLGGEQETIDLEHLLIRVQDNDLAYGEGRLVRMLEQNHSESIAILEVLTPAYANNFQLDSARVCLNRWLELEPDRLEAWLLRATVYARLINSAESLASYRRALELDPGNDDIRLQFAGHLARSGPPAEALEQFEQLRQRLGDTPVVLKGLACCKLAMNEPAEAGRLLDVVLTANPKDWRALTERGRLALQYETPEEAEKWFRKAVAVAPYESDVNYNLQQCLARLGKHQEAQEVQARMKRIDDDLARLATLTRAISQKPHDANLRCEVGVIMMRNGLEAEGARWLQSALEENVRHTESHQTLADYYERTGNTERAAQHRKVALPGAKPLSGGSGKDGP